jgi:hypothetical protein
MPGKRIMPPIGNSAASNNSGSGLPSMEAIVASGNRAQALNNADALGVKMINEGPMSPADMAMMRMYGKKGKKK